MPTAIGSLLLTPAIAYAACLVALAYLAYIVASPPPWPEDFRYIWRAGYLWSQGIDPYGPAYAAMNSAYPDAQRMSGWVYPPHWFGLAAPFGMMAYPAAFALWKTASSLLFIVGSALAWRRLALPARLTPTHLAWMLAFALTMTGVGGMLRTGQPAIVAYLGLCVVIVAIQQERRALLALGLIIAMSKPQIGLPFACLLLFHRDSRPSVVAAAILTAIASLPGLYFAEPGGGFFGMLRSGGSEYHAISVNSANSMSGLFHVVARATSWEVSVLPTTIIAAVMATGIGAWLLLPSRLSRSAALEAIVISGVCVTIAITLFHGHDLSIALLLLPLLRRLDRAGLALAGAGYLMLWRPENVLRPIADNDAAWADLTTVGITLIVIAFVRRLVAIRRDASAVRA